LRYLKLFIVTILLVNLSCATLIRQEDPFKELSNLVIKGQYEEAISNMHHLIKVYYKDNDNKRLALYFYQGRILEIQNNYKDAYEFYRERFKLLKDIDSEKIYSLRGRILWRMCYCLIQVGNYDLVNKLTAFVLRNQEIDSKDLNLIFGKISEDQQFILLVNLSVVHLFYTNDIKQLLKVMEQCKKYTDQKKKEILFLLNPWNILEIMIDETFVNFLLGYAKLESAELTNVYEEFQVTLEENYNKPYIKILLWGGQTLGIFKYIRAIILGFSGYGYSLLGRYKDSQSFFLQAINCFDEDNLKNSLDRIYLGALHVAYAYAYLIPMKENREDIIWHLKKGEELLNISIDNWTRVTEDVTDMGYNFIKPGLHLVWANFYCSEKQWEKCYLESKESINLLDRASPKLLTTESIHFTFLSENKNTYKHNIDELKQTYQKSLENLKGYDGYEMWKMYYIDSLIKEREGNLNSALESSKKSVLYLEKFWKSRFPLSQQVTFMEDKSIPYQRTVELLLKLKSIDMISEIFEYIERTKSHSLILSEGDSESSFYIVPSLKEIQESLSDEEAIIDLYYSENYSLSIFISNSETLLNISNDGEEKVNVLIDKFETSILSAREKDYIEAGFNIFSHFIKPYYNKLNNKKKLYIVPHRKLHYVAWNALSTTNKNKGNEYLIDEPYITTLIPSSIAFNLATKKRKNLTSNCSSLFIGPNIEEEGYVDAIEGLNLNCIDIYTGRRANKSSVLDELKKKKNIVLFAHGAFDKSSPFESSIKLYRDDLTLNTLQGAEIYSNFVVLAGCGTGYVKRYSNLKIETQEEMFPEADDLLGLYKTLFSKGVNSVVISVVKDTDKVFTEDILIELLKDLDKSPNEVKAFKESVLKLRSKSKYAHPYYWGAYMIVGGIRNENNLDSI